MTLLNIKTIEEIRKAYFDRKLGKLLDELQAIGMSQNDIDNLENILEGFRKEELQLGKRMSKFNDKAEPTPPTVEELRGTMTQQQKESMILWLDEAEKAVARVKSVMNDMRIKSNRNEIKRREEWLDAALDISTLLTMVDQDRVYKDQLYRAKLTTIIDDFELSRAEAEERAKLTKEYRDYKNATLFRENINEFIMICKKYYSPQ